MLKWIIALLSIKTMSQYASDHWRDFFNYKLKGKQRWKKYKIHLRTMWGFVRICFSQSMPGSRLWISPIRPCLPPPIRADWENCITPLNMFLLLIINEARGVSPSRANITPADSGSTKLKVNQGGLGLGFRSHNLTFAVPIYERCQIVQL